MGSMEGQDVKAIKQIEHGLRRIVDLPEFNVAIFSFLLNFVWEFLQVPTYAGMADLPHWQGIKVCTEATFGDVGFSLVSFWLAASYARSRHWIWKPSGGPLCIYIATGLILTIAFEFYYTEISHRWTYAALMPRLPLLGTGLSPTLQWIVVPLLVVWFVRRQSAHARGRDRDVI